MNTDYEKQGTDFLEKHGIKMTTKFEGSRRYFNDDKEDRDVFKVSFSRGSARLNIEFGQSINDSDGAGGTPPTPYDVLSCIEKYKPEGFDSWIEEFGYDEVPKGKKWTVHYRECHDMHRRCKEQWAKVSKFFSTKELDELREIN